MSRHLHVFPRCPITGKVRFGEHKDATEALRKSRRRQVAALLEGSASARREQRSYHCPHCRGWHLTSRAVWLPARESAVDTAAAA